MEQGCKVNYGKKKKKAEQNKKKPDSISSRNSSSSSEITAKLPRFFQHLLLNNDTTKTPLPKRPQFITAHRQLAHRDERG